MHLLLTVCNPLSNITPSADDTLTRIGIACTLAGLLQIDVSKADAETAYDATFRYVQDADQLDQLDSLTARNVLYIFALTDSCLTLESLPGMLSTQVTSTSYIGSRFLCPFSPTTIISKSAVQSIKRSTLFYKRRRHLSLGLETGRIKF